MRKMSMTERVRIMFAKRHWDILTPAEKRWAIDNAINYHAYRNGNICWCGRCGELFGYGLIDKGEATCPHCGTRVEIVESKRHSYNSIAYTQQLATDGEFQVVRTILVQAGGEEGCGVFTYAMPVAVVYISDNGHYFAFRRKLRSFWQRYTIPWDADPRMIMVCNGDELIKGWEVEAIMPRPRVANWARKYQLTDNRRCGLDRVDLLQVMPAVPCVETLWKEGETKLCAWLMYHEADRRRWPSIKVALRNDYRIEDIRTWMDHLCILERLGLDIMNPRYICPLNLDAEHVAMNRRLENAEGRQRIASQHEKIKEELNPDNPENVKYRERLATLLEFSATDGIITIKPLQNIGEFHIEGDVMHHCVYEAGYYEKKHTLILSARDASGIPVETIEVDTRDWVIEQSRGKYNKDSERHSEIIALMYANMDTLRKLAR